MLVLYQGLAGRSSRRLRGGRRRWPLLTWSRKRLVERHHPHLDDIMPRNGKGVAGAALVRALKAKRHCVLVLLDEVARVVESAPPVEPLNLLLAFLVVGVKPMDIGKGLCYSVIVVAHKNLVSRVVLQRRAAGGADVCP